MKALKYILTLILIVAAGDFFTACKEDDMESMSWKPGTSLHIIGSGTATVGRSRSYYVDGFTVKENYEWRLNNNVIPSDRNGEYVKVTFQAAGTYTLTVTNGKYTGTSVVTVR
jgi:hypothetical protein